MFWPTLLKREAGMMLPGKAVRQRMPATVRVVAGSKICPFRIAVPSQGLICPFGPLTRRSEKLPPRSARVGTVLVTTPPDVRRYCSHEKKAKVLSLPLYKCGMLSGPPMLMPKSYCLSGGRRFRRALAWSDVAWAGESLAICEL